MGSFVGLHTGYSGLQASQIGLDLTANNVANAHTAGYTRQRVTQSARPPYLSPVGPLGTGVQVDELTRVRDDFLDTRARTTGASASEDAALATLLGRAEDVLAEPDQGLSVAIEDVWDAFEDLVLHPAEPATRQQAESALETFSARVDAIRSGWQALQQDTEAHADALTDEANRLLERVAEIQVEVMGAGDRPVPNNLLDERDLLLDQLADLTGATVRQDPDVEGAVIVSLGGAELLKGAEIMGEVSSTAAGGELGGTLAGLKSLEERLQALDGFAGQFVDRIDLAVFGPNEAPSGLSVFDEEGKAALPFDEADPFNTSWAENVAKLRFAGPNDESSLAALWQEQVVTLASDVQAYGRSAEAKGQIAAAAGQARMSVHGVSVDEEMVHLVQYQRALEASSRIMTAVDEALDVLINRTGLVGR